MQKIDRYEIERKIPGGGMADVYLARDPNTERQVVVKVIKREYSDNEEFRVRFRREARIITTLEHAAIVPVYDFNEHEGQSFIVMRYMPGGSLLDRLKQGPLTLPEIAHIIERTADALDEAHEHDIIHRDLKPANILFDARGNAYLSDFGIAKKIAETTTKLVTTGFIGTPRYASPEQVLAKVQIDGRSDVYSLGVMVFELLTGKPPYDAETPMGTALAHVNDPIPNALALKPGLPPACGDFIRTAMAKDREERYQSAGELARELNKIAWGKPAKAEKPPLPKTLAPREAAAVPDDSRPTGLNVEPIERPLASLRPQRFGWLWLLPVALIVVLCIAASIGGALALPALFPQRTPNPSIAGTGVQLIAPTAAATRLPTKNLTPTPTKTHTPVPTVAPTLAIGSTQVSEVDGMVQVSVPAGPFTMGSDDGYDDERPEHMVTLGDFWIDKTEVTNAMYALCVQAGSCSPPPSTASYTRSNYYGDSQWDNYPVINISWNDAKSYCEWAGRRLLTEAEWEKAARGADRRKYPWGNDTPDSTLLNYNGYVADTTEVGKYPKGASPYGVLNMAGNVSEWVNDWYGENYYQQPTSENPQGPSFGQYRVLRGGMWSSINDNNVRAASRWRLEPTYGYDFSGFRCAYSP